MYTLDVKEVKKELNLLLRFVDMMEIHSILKRNENYGVVVYSYYNEDVEGYRYSYVNYLFEGGDLTLTDNMDSESFRSLKDVEDKFSSYTKIFG